MGYFIPLWVGVVVLLETKSLCPMTSSAFSPSGVALRVEVDASKTRTRLLLVSPTKRRLSVGS